MSEGTLAQVLAGEAQWCVVTGENGPVLAGLAAGSVGHVITDPPYTQRTSNNAKSAPDGINGSALNDAHSYITFGGIDGQEAGLAALLPRIAARWCVVFCALEQIGAYAAGAGKAWIRGAVWHRTNSAPQFTGDRPGQACEGVAIMHRAGRKRWNRGGTSLHWSGPTVNSCGDADRGVSGHPTPKPLWLMLDVVLAFTDPGDLILDPYAGSGTTGVAAIRLGRRCIMVEREPKWAELARERCRAEESGSTLRARQAGQVALFGGVA